MTPQIPGFEDLEQVGRGGFAVVCTARQILDVARALEAAHGVGLLHRDLKPDNLLNGRRGEINLGGFGIAGVVEGSRTASAALSMSVDHVAPEIIDGKRASVPADIYSLGSTLFEMI